MSKISPNATEVSTLRALTFRISATSTLQLPQQVPAITASLANCKSLLSTTQASATQSSSEASVAIHKYRTLLSTLLQDRTIQGRWTAIVLIKATLEIGGWETLQKSLPWVRGLLGILSKPDPPTSKKLCLITLTRIFFLTREYPTLIREITTPSLPAYIQACLQLISSKYSASLLGPILESFNQLLPRHPTIFRSYVKQLQPLLGQILAPTPSNKLGREQQKGLRPESSTDISEAARRLYVQLPSCAPKGGSSQEWDKMTKDVVSNVHRVADKVFRAVVEDWQSSHAPTPTLNGHTVDDEVQDLENDPMGLTPWSGIFAGGERLTGLLRLVKEYLANPTPNTVNLQVGVVMDMMTRLFSLTIPTMGGATSSINNVRFNNQVGKEERENLWMVLPQVHVATIEVLIALTRRFDENASPLDLVLLDQLVWVFDSEKANVQIRTGCYWSIAKMLTRSGLALPKPSVDSLAPVIRKCCDDILPLDSASPVTEQNLTQGKPNGVNQQQSSTNADAFLNSSLTSNDVTAEYVGLRQAALHLLPVLLTSIRPQHLSDSLRTRMDRTAILARHKDAMIASVLNPPPSKKFGKPAASILPLLARSFAEEKDVESLIKPRMPVVRTGAQETDFDDDIDEEGADALDEEDDEHFVGEELDTILESATRSNNAADDLMTDAPAEEVSVDTLPHSEPVPTTTSDVESKVDSSMGESTSGPISAANKRVQGDDGPLSPAKRVRFETNEDTQAGNSSETTSTVMFQSSTTSLVVSAQPEVAPPAAFADLAAQAGDVSDDNDDDDFGELVLGQDTDEESDS